MSRKSLGYTKLEWTCPRCKSRNPGPQKTCLSCGSPQPTDIKFEQAESQKIIQEQAEVEQAKKSADIHCAFCGTRNPAEATVCAQCGADLKEGARRETGQVVGAFTSEPVKQIPCPNCKAPNPDTALKCTNCGATLAKSEKPIPPAVPTMSVKKQNFLIFALIGLFVVAILCVMVSMIRGSRSEGVLGTVQDVNWITSVAIEAFEPVSDATWRDQIPNDATIENCTMQYHHTQDQPADNSVEVCGTPYTVDQGQGFAEVVQDCQYEIYQEYCEYSIMEWQQIDVLRSQGTDFSPRAPAAELTNNQRLGEEKVSYTIVFDSIKGQYTYTTDDFNIFQQCQPGSQWVLNINGFNKLVSVEPAN